MKHYDAIIIGFGKAGKTLANTLANLGKQVAMIEKSSEMYGGTCINIACIPTKALVYQSNERKYSEAPKEDFYQYAIEEKDDLTSLLRDKNFHMLADQDSVMVYTAEASFLDNHTVQLTAETETLELTAENFFINTGSVPVIPPIDGIKESNFVYSSTTLQQLETLPEKLVIIGGGYIGLEFASIYANFGSEVIILDHGTTFLPRDDRDIAEEVRKVLEAKNIKITLDSNATSIIDQDGGVTVKYEQGNNAKEIAASALLIATGRKPNTDALGLENTSIEVDDKGAIIVDDYLKTTAANIWALGDVKGGPQFTYISLDDFRIIRDQFVGEGNYTLKDRQNIPDSVFIDPVLSHVGLNEETAKKKGISYKAATMKAGEVPRSRIIKQTDGLLKALINPDTKEILGCTLFCAESSEMINIVRLAMEAKLPYTALRDHIFTHPSMSEALNDLFSKFD
ncbi:FAD-dependent oxidoreductase [Oceanobacillus chungangensis]|uniref:Pyridine nucleotide-disulfide oxidoreductase n=1 Tax=Oceanobacillus chungangensis TaxID=1229152 RepID=A0A3D8PZ02_9BACI|nr:FAD-dependent oxidoreductase [Oceanobacillus chungangensis]RDW21254.1 pyridine nucleotide-disulfide oxidoreductase [Oceanobacillus chungangensis]